jgi:pyruvate/2-oxoglutarate dehydrogenase complex dihydrolipoamide dehydrogenase (E3) component
MRVAIIERGHFGGTCVNNGCTPTKTLIASAYVAHLARRAAGYGVEAGPVKVDMPRVKARKDALVERTAKSLETWLRGLHNVTVYVGEARFREARTVTVGAQTLSAERVFINVGGRPNVPDLAGVQQVRYLTSESMMDVDFVPPHLLVVGGSYVGLEFAQMYRRFGSQVTVIEMAPRLVSREDPDVSDAICDILAAEDIAIRLEARCLALEPAPGGGIRMQVDCRIGEPSVTGTHVLLAVGRVPNTDDLGLREAGIETDDRGYIKVDDMLHTSVQNVYALGDCNGRGAFTHTAYNDYEIVADNLLSGAVRKVSDRIPIYGLFTDPPLGRVGRTEAEARREGLQILIGRMPMTQVARAREKGETEGFMKVLVDARSKQILGAAILGVGGDEAVQSLVDAMYGHLPYTVVQHGVRIHPTVSELIPTMLGELTPLT